MNEQISYVEVFEAWRYVVVAKLTLEMHLVFWSSKVFGKVPPPRDLNPLAGWVLLSLCPSPAARKRYDHDRLWWISRSGLSHAAWTKGGMWTG